MMKDEPSTYVPPDEPIILPRAEHPISRRQIDENSLKVLYRLHRNGYRAYLVGGSVRDLLLGRQPKDFDVGTDATPGQVKKLFRNCFLVGRRFRLAHIRFAGGALVEVATFRREPTPEDVPDDPASHPHYAENLFGTPRQDAFRRDFTINALFYNIADFSVIDHVGGLCDLREKRIRVIGDPRERFREDPVRMLRALEFAARLGFTLDPATADGIRAQAPLLAEASPARLREELMELFRQRVAATVLAECERFGLLPYLIPGYRLSDAGRRLLAELDERPEKEAVTEPQVLAALYHQRFLDSLGDEREMNLGEVIGRAGHLLRSHCQHFRIANGIRHQAAELLVGCCRLRQGVGRRGHQRFLRHPAFPQVLQFFELCCRAGLDDRELLQAWRASTGTAARAAGKRRRRSRRRPRRKPHHPA